MEQLEQDAEDIVVDFTVRVSEPKESPEEALAYEVNATVGLVEPDTAEQERPIGSLTAHLFDIAGMDQANAYLPDAYDMRTQHLTETLQQILDSEECEFYPRVFTKAGFDDPMLIQWHLHISGLYLEPAFRGKTRGVRALRLLRQYAQRPALLATVRAFPEEPGVHSKLTGSPIAALASYYLSDKELGLKQLGRLDEGWLVANWST
jgi:hypothetical protein